MWVYVNYIKKIMIVYVNYTKKYIVIGDIFRLQVECYFVMFDNFSYCYIQILTRYIIKKVSFIQEWNVKVMIL